jgi:hypothetical protein
MEQPDRHDVDNLVKFRQQRKAGEFAPYFLRQQNPHKSF